MGRAERTGQHDGLIVGGRVGDQNWNALLAWRVEFHVEITARVSESGDEVDRFAGCDRESEPVVVCADGTRTDLEIGDRFVGREELGAAGRIVVFPAVHRVLPTAGPGGHRRIRAREAESTSVQGAEFGAGKRRAGFR